MLRNAQREAWEVVCDKYKVEKVNYNRLCQELRQKGTKVCNLPPKPKRCLQKEIFKEVRERWERDVDMDEDLMKVDKEASGFGDDFEIEMSSFHGEGGRASPDWSGSGGEDKKEDDEDEDLMNVDES